MNFYLLHCADWVLKHVGSQNRFGGLTTSLSLFRRIYLVFSGRSETF